MPGKSNRQGHFHGRLSGGSWGAVGAERGRAFIEHHLAIESGLGAEYERWQRRDPSARRFVCVRADGVSFQPRMEEEKQCVLVLIGATRSLRQHPATTLLGSQNRQCAQRHAQIGAPEGQGPPVSYLAGRDQSRGGSRLRFLLSFHGFPAEHWKHIRTTNPIESTFATVRQRTGKTKGCLSRKTGLAMAFKLMMSAQAKWRKLDGANRMPEIIEGVEFRDGIKQIHHAA